MGPTSLEVPPALRDMVTFPVQPRVSLSGPPRSLEHFYEACEVDKSEKVLTSAMPSTPGSRDCAEE